MDITALSLRSQTPQKVSGEPYLKLQLQQKTVVLLSMNYVQEVVSLPTHQLTAMPNMPACIWGLINRRSRVLWVVDLGQILGLNPFVMATQQHHIVLIQVGSLPLGLIVQDVDGMTGLTADVIQAPLGQTPAALLPYIRGCVLRDREIALVLDAEAIAHSPHLHHAAV